MNSENPIYAYLTLRETLKSDKPDYGLLVCRGSENQSVLELSYQYGVQGTRLE